MIKFFQNIASAVIKGIGKVHWRPSNLLDAAELDEVRRRLTVHYYIMVTRRNNHLSTYFIALAGWLLTGKFSYWGHAFMNLEDEVGADHDFRIIEAIGDGVQYTPFTSVFDVNGVALLKPRSMSAVQWTAVMDRAKSELGKPYDTLFDIKSDRALSCVELVRTALMAEPDYETNFARLEALIKKEKNLTPQMLYDCGDFEVIYEVRR